jgi:hypothetical protein
VNPIGCELPVYPPFASASALVTHAISEDAKDGAPTVL